MWQRGLKIGITLTATAENGVRVLTRHARLHDWIEPAVTRDALTWQTPEGLGDIDEIRSKSRRRDQGRGGGLHFRDLILSLGARIEVKGLIDKLF